MLEDHGMSLPRNDSNYSVNVHVVLEGLPAEGLEPTRSCDHWILSPARLPVPPRRRRSKRVRKLQTPAESSSASDQVRIDSSQTERRSENLAQNDGLAQAGWRFE